MSELQPTQENLEAHNSLENSIETDYKVREKELTRHDEEHGNRKHIESLAKNVESSAHSIEHIPAHVHETENKHPVIINKQLKDVAFTRALTRAQKKLSLPSKIFSKIIHNQTIDRSSEFIGRTVARPSSMLSGAFLAFVGTSALLWLTRKHGYEYNYLVVVILFALGWAAGITAEFLIRTFRKSR